MNRAQFASGFQGFLAFAIVGMIATASEGGEIVLISPSTVVED